MTTSETVTAVAGSAVLGLLVAVGATVVGGLAGRALGGDRVPRRALVAVVLLSPVALPPFAVAMGLSPLVLRLGVPDVAATVVVLTVFAVPYTTYVFAAAHAGLDPQSEDQARMLGATRRQAVFRVTVPALRPAIAAAAFLAFLVGWGDYVVTLLIGGGQFVTLPLLVASAASGSGNEPHLAALSIVSLLPPLTTLLISSRLGSRGDRAVSPS
ncbi:ABC transporter permease [Terracoccus luteus]|uniref:Putative spermidine/putrescine transport system permease protein n=1 Tax=Terracoccus luteus TaxID=53356 RepID=A0A839PY78_9MICO|nr:ABC transporter permease subunit [Terracoccus luteus]MBB2988083.1 putative spermidine/putrescine transport system permease protein [Terracoccus luteus]MCP2173734.1 putative spermidine/putrescine transport system permease protein [Terracoccus luteus]